MKPLKQEFHFEAARCNAGKLLDRRFGNVESGSVSGDIWTDVSSEPRSGYGGCCCNSLAYLEAFRYITLDTQLGSAQPLFHSGNRLLPAHRNPPNPCCYPCASTIKAFAPFSNLAFVFLISMGHPDLHAFESHNSQTKLLSLEQRLYACSNVGLNQACEYNPITWQGHCRAS